MCVLRIGSPLLLGFRVTVHSPVSCQETQAGGADLVAEYVEIQPLLGFSLDEAGLDLLDDPPLPLLPGVLGLALERHADVLLLPI